MAEVVAQTYASSLYDTAKADKCEKEILDELSVLSQAFAQDDSFLRLMSTPELVTEEKLRLATQIFHGKAHSYTENFIKVLIEKRRIKNFEAIYQAYRDIYNSDHNRMEFTVVTAVDLSEKLREKLRQKLTKALGAEILLTSKVDPSILGGMVLHSQNKQIDASVKGKLEEIRMKIAAVVA